MVNLTKPFYIVPVHGEPRHQHIYFEMATEMGWPDHRIFEVQNGTPVCIDEKNAFFGDEVTWGEHLIDQHGNVAVTDDVLGQRAALGHDGVVVMSIGVGGPSGEITSRPEIITRGFSGPESVIEDGLTAVCDALADLPNESLHDKNVVAGTAESAMKKAIQRGCRQRPVVIAMIVNSN